MTQVPYSQYVQAAQAYGVPIRRCGPTVNAAGRAGGHAAGCAGRAGGANPSEPEGSTSPEIAGAYAVLWLRPGAPPSVVKAAYRALAITYHPDAGGDPRAMRRLNAAYRALQAHLGT